ncbi:type VI secretion system membrane subunit TssM [Inquilinus sp. NPDC058860]|uniref:type VI secretion system membrane subunit TssM n=1 Tax=Inquilinus sp. NPDC058860 TaxID=3346652 RepID=UPI0036ADF0BA
MRKVLAILTARWFVSLVGVLLLSAIVWFVGPLIAVAEVRPLETALARVVTIAAMLVIWSFATAWSIVRNRQANARLVDEMSRQQGPPPSHPAQDPELALIRDRLAEALATLRRTRVGRRGSRRWLYELPWYILIGPPGAGKTTALLNSGLDFPLAERAGQSREAIRGIGGTRNCDWWFTNEAVLIDTAGRYTTQDSHATRDAAAWHGFLGLLKRHRPRQPINGALVCVSVSDIALMPESERTAHARAIRQRLDELTNELGIRFPVYVLLTKADLLAGFAQFFDDLGREEREQIWGTTFAFDDGQGEEGVLPQFLREFDLLVERLNDRVIERLHQEPDIRQRSLIYGFPAQVASLRGALDTFLTEAFRPSRYTARPLLRGVYLTSGTQEGTPFDRLMGAMAQSFGLDRQQIASTGGRGRSYFLTALLRRVVFAEAGMVSTNPRLERRLRWLRRGAVAAACAALVAALAGWTASYMGNSDLIRSARASLDDYAGKLGASGDPVRDSDLAAIVPPLDALRGMPAGYDRRDAPVPVSMRLGLYQGDTLSQATVQAYRHALNSLLLPRLIVRLEEILRGIDQPSDLAYIALKVYLTLGGKAPASDPDAVMAWLEVDLQQRYPGDRNAALRAAIEAHTAALLERRVADIGIDGQLVERVRTIVAAVPPAGQAYRLLSTGAEVAALPEWTAGDHAGPQGARVLARSSGKGLGEGIPGLFTYRGFHEAVLPGLETAARAIASERWVVDRTAPTGAPEDEAVAQIARDALQLYYDDYVSNWNALLADIRIVPFESRQHAVEALNILSGPSSPLSQLLRAAATETKLTAPPPEGGDHGAPESDQAGAGREQAAETAGASAEAAAQSRFGMTGRVAALLARDYARSRLGGSGDNGAPEPPGRYVEDRFRDLQTFVEGPNGAPAPLDDMIRTLADIYQQMNRSAMTTGSTGAAANAELTGLAQQLTASAGRAPAAMRGWAGQIAEATSSVTVGGARQTLNADWNSGGRELCRAALTGRYPFARGAREDVKLDDFARLFAPGGLIDGFFTKNLAQYVDTSTSPWRWGRVNNVDLGIDAATLTQFERAARIRDAFFPQGGNRPDVGFEIEPVDLSAGAASVTLDINGQVVSYDHGPVRPVSIRWPGTGSNQVRVSFAGVDDAAGGGLTLDGPWALFRLVDRAKIAGASASDRFRFTVADNANSATFDLRTASVLNPFTLPELRQFQCPQAF